MEEILHGLNCALPLDPRRIRQDSEQLWRSWDSDGDNAIQLPEFLNRKEGLLGYLLTTYGRNDAEQPVPPLSQATVRDWFQYWDEDSSGSLSKDELVRAVVKTLRLEAVHDVSALRSVIEAVWFLFDSDGNGVIDLGEFLATDGLADTLLATLQSS
jgi:Ca2+-binding EF-hand superfamily protein